MASSWTSRSHPPDLRSPSLPDDIRALRFTGWRGDVITPHRSFAHVRPRVGDFLGCAVLVLGLSLAWVALLPSLGLFWQKIFLFWSRALGLHADVVMVPQSWGPLIRFSLPFLNVAAGPIPPYLWWVTAAVTVGALALTYFTKEEMLPWIDFVRWLVLIQAASLVYFAFASERFPHDLPSYTVGMLLFGVILVGMLPLILALTYYLFDFTFSKKLALTLMAMIHLSVFIPLQYMLHAYILHSSILFMPILYFVFGPFLDVVVFISFYSWGMSWQRRNLLSA